MSEEEERRNDWEVILRIKTLHFMNQREVELKIKELIDNVFASGTIEAK